MGRASIVTTTRYIHATDKAKRGAITVSAAAPFNSSVNIAEASQTLFDHASF
jgi:hypothetical protein